MPLASTTVIKLTNFPPTLPNVPAIWPIRPAPCKLALLLKANSEYLYHRFSPYTNYHDSLFAPILSNKQPFVYTFIDQKDDGIINQLPETVKQLVNIVGVNQASVNDVVRVSKFLISSWGVQFLITQAAIQRLAPFDETRIYNPLSPILATVQPLTAGVGTMPTRHIEGGLLGLASSVTGIVGINLQSGFRTPSSTAGDKALPLSNLGQGKGLIRGNTATRGKSAFNSKWFPNGIGALKIASAAQFFGLSQPKQPFFTNVRADQSSAYIMAISSMPALKVAKRNNGMDVIPQMWYPSKPESFGELNSPYFRSKMFSFGIIQGFQYIDADVGLFGTPTINNSQTGYDITSDKRNVKYSDHVKIAPEGTYTNSDMLVQYAYYIDEKNSNFQSKFTDRTSVTVKKIENDLQQVINNIGKEGTYKVFNHGASYLLPRNSPYGPIGYDKWSNYSPTNPSAPKNTYGVIQEYNTSTNRTPSIDAGVKSWKNLRMATTFMSDGINTLGVLGKNRVIDDKNSSVSNAYKASWTEWNPYEDDLIAFFFYDVVNDKYIPFRATVKGISEGNTAFWDELRFIGRSDQLYSYNGFSRTLSFSFNVVISSVSELLPSWKKINYMASSVKPSNYTTGQMSDKFTTGGKFNRFIVPPMFMLTIGDLYKFQPIVITSINVNIPDDASWETLNQDNSKLGWSYLNGLITAPNLGKKYGQLPREVEISITCNLLEKERAVVGGSHFGHGPRVDNWETIDAGNPDRFVSDSSVPFLPAPTILHQEFVEWNDPGSPNPVTPLPIQRSIVPTPIPANANTRPTPTGQGVSGYSGNNPMNGRNYNNINKSIDTSVPSNITVPR